MKDIQQEGRYVIFMMFQPRIRKDVMTTVQPLSLTKLLIFKVLHEFKMWGDMMCSGMMCQTKQMILTVLPKFKM